jgi:two-component system sensor histidine kinase YesM
MFKRLHNLFFSSIRVRLMLFIFLIALVPLIVLGYLMFHASSSIINESVTQNTSETMNQVLDNIEFHLQTMDNAAQDVVYDSSFFNKLKTVNGSYDYQDIQSVNEIKALLTKELSIQKGLKSIFLIGDKYFFISNSDTYIYPAQISIQEQMKNSVWYKKAVEMGGRSVFTIVESESSLEVSGFKEGTQNRTIRLVRLLRNIQTGDPIGVLGVDMDSRMIDNIVSKLQIEYYGLFIVVDDEGNLIYKLDPNNRFEDSGQLKDLGLDKLKSGVDQIKIQGKETIRINKSSSLTGWRVIQYIPYSELITPIVFIQRLTMITVIICLAAAFVMSLFVSNRLVKPLKNLVGLTKKVQQGHLDVRLDDIRQDEIGYLSANFNIMISRLREMHDEIYREQELKRQAELSALQAQIQPHFLYNTLDSVKWMAVIRGELQISEMITALVNLLRNSISLGKETITVRKEVENLKNYILIQHMRYYHVFEVTYHVEDEVLDMGIPKLILQPLVENSLYHGIDTTKQGGRIELAVEMKQGYLVCKIMDNGKGMSQEHLKAIMEGKVKSQFSGISVKNVDERLKLHYGPQFGLVFQSEEGQGTTVTIRIPAVDIKEDSQNA